MFSVTTALLVAAQLTVCPAFVPHLALPRASSPQHQSLTRTHSGSSGLGFRSLRSSSSGSRDQHVGGLLRVRMCEGSDATETKDIFEALMTGDMAAVKEYVDAGGDCSVKDSIGDTPLMLAVESDMPAAVKALISQGGANVNNASDTTGETPLQLAAYYGYTHLARVLVEDCGAELETCNKKGGTALSLACFWGNTDTVEYLLEAGADPNNAKESGERPGDEFDAVFVPAAQAEEDTGAEEGAGGGAGGGGPREAIIEMLENARAAKSGAPVAATDGA